MRWNKQMNKNKKHYIKALEISIFTIFWCFIYRTIINRLTDYENNTSLQAQSKFFLKLSVKDRNEMQYRAIKNCKETDKE